MVENALGDAQWAGDGTLALIDLDQPVEAQRRGRRERAPVRIEQAREGEAEGRSPGALVPGRRGAQLGEARLQLDPRAEQQHVPLEGREPERADERLQHRRVGPGLRRIDGLPVGVRLQCSGDPLELAAERSWFSCSRSVTAAPVRLRVGIADEIESALCAVDLHADEVRPRASALDPEDEGRRVRRERVDREAVGVGIGRGQLVQHQQDALVLADGGLDLHGHVHAVDGLAVDRLGRDRALRDVVVAPGLRDLRGEHEGDDVRLDPGMRLLRRAHQPLVDDLQSLRAGLERCGQCRLDLGVGDRRGSHLLAADRQQRRVALQPPAAGQDLALRDDRVAVAREGNDRLHRRLAERLEVQVRSRTGSGVMNESSVSISTTVPW